MGTDAAEFDSRQALLPKSKAATVIGDVRAGFVVFLIALPLSIGIALPLSIGIALAAGAPPTAGILGGLIIRHLMKTRDQIRRDSGILYPDAVTLLLLSTLALSAFPVTQACWGEEMLLGDLWLRLPILTAACIVVLVWNGFILMRLFVGLCFGQGRVGLQLPGAAFTSPVHGATIYAGQGSTSGTFST